MLEKSLKKSLQELQLKAVLKSKLFEPLLIDCLKTIKSESSKAENEATIESAFDISLYGLLSQIGIKIFPEKEKKVNTIRHTTKGRMDSNIGAFVMEFKHASKLKTDNQIKEATNQIKEYMGGLAKSNDEIYFFGAITDGTKIKFISLHEESFLEEDIHDLSLKDIVRLIKNIISLETKALTSKNLINVFCEDSESGLANKLIRVLYKTLKNSPTHRTHMLNSEWERLFKLGHEDKSHQKTIEERGEELSKIVGEDKLEILEQYKVLFSIQTVYAIIIKLIGYRVISDIVFKSPLESFKSLSKADDKNLRIFFSDFEDGATFREIGIDNLLEGDFFSWYCSEEQWNKEIFSVLKEVISKLSDYEDKQDIFHKSKINDLFRELYQRIMPSKVRHALGEFYTPKWLAQNLLENIEKRDNWKGLDPCAGSGTFVISMIEEIIKEQSGKEKNLIFNEIINRVKGIDLNPLAVLTARVNYFIAISPYIPDEIDYFEIPIYLGDSANIPKSIKIDNISCYSYILETKLEDLNIIIPKSALRNPKKFSQAMYLLEQHINSQNKEKAISVLLSLIDEKEKSDKIISLIDNLVSALFKLESNNWNRIWARIIKNFLTTSNLGKFDIIIGNPPWIDWKNLPTGYREKIKSLCIKKELFSGDSLTGGINLNICALITNVVAENWLSENGNMAFLMPKSIIFQQTYEGFRKFKIDDNKLMYLKEIHDWTKSGSPFFPVQIDFLTYYFSFKKPTKNYVDVKVFFKKKNKIIKDKQNNELSEIKNYFDIENLICGQLQKDKTAYTYAKNLEDLKNLKRVSGECYYKGREGIEFYPQEIFVLKEDLTKTRAGKGIIWVKNTQNTKSKYKIPERSFRLEKDYLFPLVKGVDIEPFGLKSSNLISPFPYEIKSGRNVLNFKELEDKSPLLLKYFKSKKEILGSQSEYNSKIQGKYGGIFYSLTRVGNYSFAPYKVVYRDNTKWCASVVSDIKTSFGGNKMALPQNHAPYISENKNRFITKEEAHYICAIMNSPTVEKFILQSSDSRTFKITPPIFIPEYNNKNKLHCQLSKLSTIAHGKKDDIERIRLEIDKIYISICKQENKI